MTLFSRCEAPSALGPTLPRLRGPSWAGAAFVAFAGFAEDLGILFRYAFGLDYVGRGASLSADLRGPGGI